MKIIRPLEVSEARLASSNVPEDDYPEYAAGTPYARGDRVMVKAVHRIYEALADSTGKYPPDNTTGKAPPWVEVGATNRWAMFDGVVGTATSASAPLADGAGSASGIDVTIEPGEVINALAFFGLAADALVVTVTDPIEGEVYRRVEDLVSSTGIDSWYAYFFEPLITRSDLVLTDLPSYGGATVRITLTSSAGDAACSLVIPGRQTELGGTRYGTSAGITDYSRKERDEFGRTLVVPRAYSKRMSPDVFIERHRVDYVHQLLAQYRATPLVWVGSENYGSLLVYGYYRDFDIVIEHHEISECAIEIEGLT